MAADRGRARGKGARRAGAIARLAAAGIGAMVGRSVLRTVLAAPGERLLRRDNFHGRSVSLAGGPALALGATAGAALGADDPRMAAAVAVAGLGAGAVGLYDDIAGARPEQRAAKGFHGHLAALRQGQITAGLVKILGVGAAGLAAAMIMTSTSGRRRTAVDVVLDAGVIAGSANLVNLLDLRPGRALKAGMTIAAPLASRGGRASGIAAGTVGAASALISDDLDERIMLGDGGANAFGALIGTAVAARGGRLAKTVALAGIAGLTLASEKISFTRVIARTPVLRELDELGRRRPEVPVQREREVPVQREGENPARRDASASPSG